MNQRERFESGTGPIGLDDRPRPASARARIVLGLRQSTPFSSLQRRIIFFNLAGLAFLVLGVLWLNQFRSGLIEERIQGLETQAELIALTIAETAGYGEGRTRYDEIRANIVLGRMVELTDVRARIYDSRMRLTGDSRLLYPKAIEEAPLAPPTKTGDAGEPGEDLTDGTTNSDGTAYREVDLGGISRDAEVMEAVGGGSKSVVRVNPRDQLIVSVAVPIRRSEAILGALVLSTEGGDIDAIVRNERIIIFQVFIVAAIVSMGLSILLANTIAAPIRELAAAADSGGTTVARPISPDRVEIPDMSDRSDEIGELSGALRAMTDALYKRIDAIEAFASDVAHEIKNPLTSLRSAVETMEYAKTPEQRQKLLDVIMQDVGRMDRLVTDISNASRLDAELVREKMQPFDLGQLVAMLADITRSQGEKHGVRVRLDMPSGKITARGLEGRIAQVVTNLFDNALSFSPENGEIRVRIETRSSGLRLLVEDQGPGVPPENIRSVFERFYTERPASEAFGNHSGLGLSISKQIVEAHGGRIWVENIVPPGGELEGVRLGARFVVDLPA